MLEFLISSASKRKVIIYLLNNQGKEFHLREISRNIGEPAPLIKREMDRLEQMGFVLSWKVENRRCFKVNKTFLFLPELKSLVDKFRSFSTPLKVTKTFVLKETMKKREIWGKRSREIARGYGDRVERRRPRHPAETKLREMIS